MPLANARAKLTASGTAPTTATFTAMWRPSTRAAPAITGIASKKLNSAGDAEILGTSRHHTAYDRPQPASVHDQHGAQRRHVERNLHEYARRMHAGHDLEHAQVARARYREKLREALDQPEDEALPERHATRPATSATTPSSIAPVSQRLLPRLRPADHRLATA